MFDVVEIVVDAGDRKIGVRGAAAAAADLGEAGDPWLDGVALKIIRHQTLIERAGRLHARHMRARTDK